jgi:Domain of unknown function (DUF6285)
MPSNRPTSAELLQAVGGFLKAEVLPLLNGNEKYHLQVAINAVAILGREFASAAQFDAAEQERLGVLLGVTGTREELNRLLCLRIRERQLTYRDLPLRAHLMQTAIAKMSIDNPKYATYTRALHAMR